MKNLTFGIALLFAATFFSTSASAQNSNNSDNWFIAKAKVAANACTSDVNGPITGNVSVASACFVSGFITEVYLYRKPTGPNASSQLPALLAIVQFGCDNEIISVDCQ